MNRKRVFLNFSTFLSLGVSVTGVQSSSYRATVRTTTSTSNGALSSFPSRDAIARKRHAALCWCRELCRTQHRTAYVSSTRTFREFESRWRSIQIPHHLFQHVVRACHTRAQNCYSPYKYYILSVRCSQPSFLVGLSTTRESSKASNSFLLFLSGMQPIRLS